MAQPLQLTTRRLLLRNLQESDFGMIHRHASDPEVTRYMDWGPNSEDDTIAYLRTAVEAATSPEPKAWDLGVIERPHDEFLGIVGIRLICAGRAEVGYWLAKNAWGRGIATEAVETLVAFGFDQLGLHRVEARCDPENSRSARVLEKIGMVREGCLRQSVCVRGQWKDRLMLAVLKQDWKMAHMDTTS